MFKQPYSEFEAISRVASSLEYGSLTTRCRGKRSTGDSCHPGNLMGMNGHANFDLATNAYLFRSLKDLAVPIENKDYSERYRMVDPNSCLCPLRVPNTMQPHARQVKFP
ncbi:hypothetical protein VNO77_22891 [Canavalia gladiata]|uniref:Uncharacterized protein n=1 Tax=Canavalia gladiata TaxID=3824 RepID=A0AAN9L4C9_CANGL